MNICINLSIKTYLKDSILLNEKGAFSNADSEEQDTFQGSNPILVHLDHAKREIGKLYIPFAPLTFSKTQISFCPKSTNGQVYHKLAIKL